MAIRKGNMAGPPARGNATGGIATGGTDAAASLNKGSSIADYMRARGAQPVDGTGAARPQARRIPPNKRAKGMAQGPGGPQGGPVRGTPPDGGLTMGRGAKPAVPMPPPQGGPVRPMPQGDAPDKQAPQPSASPPTIAPGGSMAQAGNPSAQRAAAFNAQRLAGPARPVSENGLSPPPNAGGPAPPTGLASRPSPGSVTPRPPTALPPAGGGPQPGNSPGAGPIPSGAPSNVTPKPKPMQEGGGGGAAPGPQPGTALKAAPRPQIA